MSAETDTAMPITTTISDTAITATPITALLSEERGWTATLAPGGVRGEFGKGQAGTRKWVPK